MPDNKKPPTPSKEWVNYYLQGISLFFPNIYYGEKKGATLAAHSIWEDPPIGQKNINLRSFYKNLMDATNTNSIDEAFNVVKEWKLQYDEGIAQPEQTTPGEIDLKEQVEAMEGKKPNLAQQKQEKTVRDWIDDYRKQNPTDDKPKLTPVTHVTTTIKDISNIPNMYVVAEEKAPNITLNPEDAKRLRNMLKAVKEDSSKFSDDLKNAIISAAPDEYKQNLSPQDFEDIATITSQRFTDKLRNLDSNSNTIIQYNPVEILAAISDPNRADFKKLVPDEKFRAEIAAAAQETALANERESLNAHKLLSRVPEVGGLSFYFIAPKEPRNMNIKSEEEMKEKEQYGHRLGPQEVQDLINNYKKALEIKDKIKQGKQVVDEVVKNTAQQNMWYQPAAVRVVAKAPLPSIFAGGIVPIETTIAEGTVSGMIIPYYAAGDTPLLTAGPSSLLLEYRILPAGGSLMDVAGGSITYGEILTAEQASIAFLAEETIVASAAAQAAQPLAMGYVIPLYGGAVEFGMGVISTPGGALTEIIGFRMGELAFGLGRTWVSAAAAAPEYTLVITSQLGKTTLSGPVVDFIGTKVLGLLAPEVTGAAVATTTTAAVTGTELVAAPAAGTAIGGPVGFVIGLIIAAVTWVATKVIPKIISWVKTHKKDLAIVPIALVAGGLTVGGVTGSVIIVTGLVSGVGYMTMMAGGVVPAAGLVGGGVYTVVQGFTSVIIPAIAAPVVIVCISLPLMVAFMIFIINAGAYVVPPPGTVFSEQAENPYIRVNKTANPTAFDNSELKLNSGKDVLYTITITAKKTRLTNIRFKNECSVSSRDGGSPPCPNTDPDIPSSIPDEILPGESYSFEYKQNFKGNSFADSSVTDLFTVTADSPEAPNASASDMASVCIGDCPDECPSDWPILPEGGESYLLILSGPCVDTHATNCLEAMDVDATVGHNIYATHSGTATASHTPTTNSYGNFVTISSVCNGKSFYSLYAHLSVISVSGPVKKGQIIGSSGATSSVPGFANDHLHYEFSGQINAPIKLVTPYVPRTIPRMCLWTSSPSCGTIP